MFCRIKFLNLYMIGGEYNFRKDLIKGEKGEECIINYMIPLGFELIERCKDNRWDFIMRYSGKDYSYEIKTDSYPKDTGNIVVEIESWGKLSGINVTQAVFFVTYFPNLKEIWNIRTENLKCLILENNIKIIENTGDKGSNTKIHLINKNKFRKHFKVYSID